MIFLGMDTTTTFGSIALAEETSILAEWSLNVPRTHAGRLLPGIQRLLRETGVQLEQLGGVAVTIGPGSFTGLRIGLATAKTMAMVTGKPLVGITTLDVLAESVPGATGMICPALDARRGELYTALYRRDDKGGTARLTDYLAVTPQALLERIEEPALLLGDGIRTYGEQLTRESGSEITLAPMEYDHPRASTLCRLALERLSSQEPTSPRDLGALYIRPSDAELNRKGVGQRASKAPVKTG